MRALIAGNWKMNGSLQAARDLIYALNEGLEDRKGLADRCDLLVCPTFIQLQTVGAVRDKNIALGAQDCSEHPDGAVTGQISAGMLKDAGCSHVILGHSERRQYAGETDTQIRAKAQAAHGAGLVAIICVGESEAERDAGHHEAVVGGQLAEALPPGADAANTVIAYEPVWAIGTGKTASAADIAAMHAFIRAQLQGKAGQADAVRILYGGSVKPGNAAEILACDNVNGALIGGASLDAQSFRDIAAAAA